MKFSLSTNWCYRRLEDASAIVDKALELGFQELELGFRTTAEQAAQFRKNLDRLPVGSVHAFCPVPLSAPEGHPELYSLASLDEEERKMAQVQVIRNIRFAAEMGADAVVLHAGRIRCESRLAWLRRWRRQRGGHRLMKVFCAELEELAPVLSKFKVTLALENLPYFGAFPDAAEMAAVMAAMTGGWVKPWFDTGHALVMGQPPLAGTVGLHISDTQGERDEHLAPGEGKVDFAALRDLARAARHLVFEPNPTVTDEALRAGVCHIRELWKE